MTTMTTTAWVGHDLALAAGLGSGLFKQIALPTGVGEIASESVRARVLTRSWVTFAPVGVLAMAFAAGTWIAGRVGIGGRIIGSDARALVIAKDVCIAGGLATVVAGMFLDRRLLRDANDGTLQVRHAMPSVVSEPTAAQTLRAANLVGALHTLFVGGALMLTTVLAAKAATSTKWNLFSRWLP